MDLLVGFRTNAFVVVYGAAAKWIQTPAGVLYGKTSLTDLLERLRPDERFGPLDALVAQMAIDKARAREVLKRESHTECG